LDGEKPAIATLDLAVPESPAFTVLGLTPESVVRPTSPRELALSLLNGVDANNNFQAGVAVDTVPFTLLFGEGFTLGDYRRDPVERALARLQLSVATAKGTSEDDEAVRLGLGLPTRCSPASAWVASRRRPSATSRKACRAMRSDITD
jgi:hypothetical protein